MDEEQPDLFEEGEEFENEEEFISEQIKSNLAIALGKTGLSASYSGLLLFEMGCILYACDYGVDQTSTLLEEIKKEFDSHPKEEIESDAAALAEFFATGQENLH